MTVITTEIWLEPNKLTSNLESHIMSQLSKLENTCSKKHGYIINIETINSYNTNYISTANSNIVFSVNFNAKTLKPEIGSIFTGCIEMVFPGGIILIIEKRMKILIPTDKMLNYKYNQLGFCFQHDDKVLNKDDTITVSITNVRYDKGDFSCIGELKEK